MPLPLITAPIPRRWPAAKDRDGPLLERAFSLACPLVYPSPVLAAISADPSPALFGLKTALSGANGHRRPLGRRSAGESRDSRPGRLHSRIAGAAEARRRAGAGQDGTTALVGLRGGHGRADFLDRFADFGPVVLLGRVGEQAQRVEQGA